MSTMPDFEIEILPFLRDLTQRVGTQLLQDFGSATAEEKADGSLVTNSDVWADGEIRAALSAQFPDYGIVAEESDRTLADNEWCWVVDPIDGTTNFSRGVPVWGISIGLLYRGTPVFGLVHFPPTRQTYRGVWAGETGLKLPEGAFLNDTAIATNPDAPTGNHLFSFCSRSITQARQPFPCKIRMVGVATYNLLTVASGVALGALEATPKIWDIAGVYPILRAAGATWVMLDGRSFPLPPGEDYSAVSFPSLVVARPELVEQFQEVLDVGV